MPTGPDRIAVLALQLARTDRRALSQAWFDALHVAGQCRIELQKPRPQPDVTGSARPAHGDGPSVAASRPGNAVVARPDRGGALRPGSGQLPPGSARVVNTCKLPAAMPRPLAQTVALGTGRVQLLVRSDAAGTRVVAICAAADRERVARALAAVRVALAGAGVTVAA